MNSYVRLGTGRLTGELNEEEVCTTICMFIIWKFYIFRMSIALPCSVAIRSMDKLTPRFLITIHPLVVPPWRTSSNHDWSAVYKYNISVVYNLRFSEEKRITVGSQPLLFFLLFLRLNLYIRGKKEQGLKSGGKSFQRPCFSYRDYTEELLQTIINSIHSPQLIIKRLVKK